MGEWPVNVGETMGAVFGASGGFDQRAWSGPSGLYAGPEEGRTRRRRIEIRHRSLTLSGPIRLIERATEDELLDLALEPRPPSRGECRDLPRPCPYVSCKHHLLVEVNPVTGSVQFPFGALGIDEIPNTCSLDVAEQEGPLTLEEVGRLTSRTKERIRQLETKALVRMYSAGVSPSMICATMDDWLDL